MSQHQALSFPERHSLLHHNKTCFVFASSFGLWFPHPPLCLTFDCVCGCLLVPVGSLALRLCLGPQMHTTGVQSQRFALCPVLLSVNLHERLHAAKKQSQSGFLPALEI